MKKIELIPKMIAILLITGFGLSACDQADEVLVTEFVSIINVGEEGETNVDIDGLVKSAITGKGAMPPRGGGAGLSDEQLKAAIEFMMQ